MAEQPKIAGKQPIPVAVVAGKTYWWCACGQSKNQPFCDGSHKGTAFEPVSWTAEKSGNAFFCACKRTGKVPLCDGTHNGL
ncbi:CDGSH iron-sulfur domain-containing protein [Hyphomonas johnsonii]|jgi:CDGSH-type Zn-finger protein|uniref:Zinc finger CDGSH-type domain-containing protein n=1 Tax=Hyphomonas johnsonii MHS-2 TaxID=1280950 RepID=A0A059FK08_9PROT|nr:CDGSH iron-sulfur domain-containing protein [Hyphomonas johnsonii]KCZ90823.1 zinc finger CDGSH-type domain-containing protein [Hyphomonas johnsonii MHS-2]